jgi:type III secretion protein W
MGLIIKMFKENGITLPPGLTPLAVSDAFMELVGDRYPSGDKVLGLAQKLNIAHSTMGQIIVFQQMRDIVRELPVQQIYNTHKHRDEVFGAIIEALEELEDRLEEEEEEDL